MTVKADAIDIELVVDGICKASWLTARQRRWPHFLYHHTSIHNAVEIIRSGALYSRNLAKELDLLIVDAAHPAIIGASPWAHDLVRLYFRPKTPTHWWVEGVRPHHRRHQDGPYIAVPVFLLFDARRVLCLDAARFSTKTLANHADHSTAGDANSLASMEFRDVYHVGALPRAQIDKERIQGAKQAEVVIPHELSLQHLRGVVCRSRAEKETLAYLLRESGIPEESWPSIVVETSSDNIFHHEWLYVREVRVVHRTVVIYHHLPSRVSVDDQYDVEVRLTRPDGQRAEARSVRTVDGLRTLTIRPPWTFDRVEVECRVFGDLVYKNTVRGSPLV